MSIDPSGLIALYFVEYWISDFQPSDSPAKALSHLLLPPTQAMDHLLPSGEHYKEIKEDLVPFPS